MRNEFECRYLFEEPNKCNCVFLTLNNNKKIKIANNNCNLHCDKETLKDNGYGHIKPRIILPTFDELMEANEIFVKHKQH